MSETAPEPAAGGNAGGVLRRKLGPLPVWGWLAIVTVLGLGYYLLEKNKSGSSSGTAVTGTGSVTPASSVPDYVSQTTINLAQPPSPDDDDADMPAPSGKKPPAKPPAKKPPAKKPPAKKPPAGKEPGGKQPPLMSGSYTVKPGDTLDKLAEKFGISRVDLAHANGLGTGAGLKTGTVLHVPGPLKTRAEGGPG
ncbi:MAG TPA: LysM domain-containing protein [Mycobacterium sp.]|jgi:LysM repeat protein|uniref:LysM peptidoglycan-binding domain-containing protein n=1 Tax=Mycobacterium sp. TaxID=1785 RepID=UPI002F3E7EFF